MNPYTRLIVTFAIIIGSLVAGYITQQLTKNFKGEKIAAFRKMLQNVAIFFFMPFGASLSLWGLAKPSPELLLLPFFGIVSYICGGYLAIKAAKLLKLSNKLTGSLYCCGTFTNLGAIGGIVSLFFVGEASIAIVALYRIFEEIYYFGISFPVAKSYSLDKNRTGDTQNKKNIFSPAVGFIVIALTIGIMLNLNNVYRPDYVSPIASTSILISTFLLLFTIGMTLRFTTIGKYWKECVSICGIKFICLPIIIISLAYLFNLNQIENGLPLKTVAILSCMPVAMTALIPPSLFDLDIDLANACWIVSTTGLIFVLPALIFLLPHL